MIDNCELMKHMNAGMYVASSHKGRLKFLDVLIVTRQSINQYAFEFPAKQKTGKGLQIHSNKRKTVQMNSREKFASELVGRIFAGTSDWSYILYEPAKILTRVQPFFGKQNLRLKKSLICLTGEMKAIHIDQACGVTTYLHNHITPCPTNMISISPVYQHFSGSRPELRGMGEWRERKALHYVAKNGLEED